MSTSGGGSKDGSSSDRELEKRKDTAGTGREKDLTNAVTASLSPTGGEASVSKGATEIAASSPYASLGSNRSLSPGGGGSDAVGTTVNQEASENAGVATPRTDASVILAGQVGTKPDRSPSRSNNFVSLVGGAGGLGRRTQQAKRTLIGGA